MIDPKELESLRNEVVRVQKTAEESVSRDGREHRGQHGEEGPGGVCRRMRRV